MPVPIVSISFTIATLLKKLPAVDPRNPEAEVYVKFTRIDTIKKSKKSILGTSQNPLKIFKMLANTTLNKNIANIPLIDFPDEI